MKKKALIISMTLCLVFTIGLAGCGSDDESGGTDLPYDYDLSEYVTLGEYKGIEVHVSDKVREGDNINIDNVGRIGGEEFEGGSTNGAGTDITVGQAG